MATPLFLRNTSTHGVTGTGDGLLFDLSDTPGAAVDTCVTNTTAGGTEIQATKTAGGSTVAWISGRAPVGGFTLTSTDISMWQRESNMNANIGGRFRLFKRAVNGTITEIAGGPFNDGAEMATSDQEDLWTGNVTDTAIAEDERLLLRYYLTNAGTMGNGHTGTLTFNAASAATGDSFLNLAETVTFKANAQTISGVGNIASAEAFGTAKLNRTVSPSGIATAQAVGTAIIGSDLGIGDGLVSFWKLGENAGVARNDSVGSNHLTEQGGTVAKFSPGKIGDAAAFIETSFLSAADSASLSITGNLSLCAWVRLEANLSNDFAGIVSKWAVDNRSFNLIYNKPAQRFTFSVSSNGTGETAGVAANNFGAPSNTVWYLLQAYADHDNDQIGIRVNDGAWNTASYTGASIFDGAAALEVGRLATSGNVLYGEIDGVGLWSRRLSDANWNTLWNSGNGIEVISPVAKAGLDQTRMELETVFLDGSQSVGDGLTYSWAQISGTAVTINNPTSPTPSFTAPDVSTPESLVFELTVEELDTDTDSDQVAIRIVPTGSNEWLSHTPQEAGVDPDIFYPTFDSIPEPLLIARDGRVIGAKGDLTLEGYTWSASKMLTSLIAARQIHLNNIELTDTIPNSDFPSSPTAILFQFLNMTSDYGLDAPSHSPGDHFAYNNGSVHHYGTHLKTTFYAGQTHVQTLEAAYVTALGFEDSLIYETTTWAGDNKMSGWNGGWKMSTRDLARIAQLVLQRGVWNGTQILDPDYMARELWKQQIPEVATQSTDEDDPFYNQAGTSAVLKDDWSLGFWYLTPAGIQQVTEEFVAMFGLYGTDVYVSREYGLIAATCNLGGETTQSPSPRITAAQVATIIGAIETPPIQFITLESGIVSAQAVGTATISASIGATGIASAEAIGSATLSQGSTNIAPTGIATAEVIGDPALSITVAPSGIASAQATGTPALARTVSPSAVASGEALGTALLSRTITTTAITSDETFGAVTVSTGALTINVSAITSTEAFGSHTILRGSVTLTPPSIATSEVFGSATVSSGALFLTPPSIASGEAVGTLSLSRTVSVSGITSAETFGATSLARTISTVGIATAEVFGTAFLSRTVSLSAIATAEAFGDPVVSSGALFLVPGSIASAESFGSHTLAPGSVTISPADITSSEVFGPTSLARAIHLPSVDSQEAFGTSTLHRSLITISIAAGETFGSLVINSGGVILFPAAIASLEGFGSASVTRGAVAIEPTGITGAESVESPALSMLISAQGIASTETLGDLIVQSGAFFVLPSSVASLEAFGVLTVGRGSVSITASGIDSAEAMGAMQVNRGISFSGIVSSEAFGSALVHAYGPGGPPQSTGRTSSSFRFANASVSSKTDVSVRRGR